MNPGIYEICPVIDGMAAWPWGQIVIRPLTSSRFPDPRRVEPAGTPSDEADGDPRRLRLVGPYLGELT